MEKIGSLCAFKISWQSSYLIGFVRGWYVSSWKLHWNNLGSGNLVTSKFDMEDLGIENLIFGHGN